MKDYIDRQEVIKTVAFHREDLDGVDHALNSIKSIPSADVAPVVHSKWLSVGHKLSRICSRCYRDEPYKFADDNANVYDYCPHCGAKMDLN